MLCSKAWVLQHGLHVCVGNGVLIIDGALHEAWDMLGKAGMPVTIRTARLLPVKQA